MSQVALLKPRRDPAAKSSRSVEDDLPKESNEGSTLNHEGTVGWEMLYDGRVP